MRVFGDFDFYNNDIVLQPFLDQNIDLFDNLPPPFPEDQ